MQKYTAKEKLEAVERELSFRRRVYPRNIEKGTMTKALAATQIAIFEEIAEDYRAKETEERLI